MRRIARSTLNGGGALIVRSGVAFLVAALMAASAEAESANLPRLHSSAFGYKYEMEMSPTSEDIDGDGSADFTLGGSPQVSCNNGILDCTFAGNTFFRSMTDSGAGSVWRKFVSEKADDGYTIELRMKLLSQTTGTAMSLTVSDGSDCDMCLDFNTNNLAWNGARITNIVTTSAYHDYRIAKIQGENRFVLWCDGVLVKDDLGDAFQNKGLNRILFGAIGGAYAGRALLRHLRFTRGAYAPDVLAMDSFEFTHKYEMNSDDTRFSPTATTSDWEHYEVDDRGTATLAGGVLSVEQPPGVQRNYKTVAPMDSAIMAQSPFTLEIKARVTNAWNPATDKVLNIYCGTPRATANFYIGTTSVMWDEDQGIIHTGDNSDAMHVFRLTYEGDGLDGFSLWRDGEKIAENVSTPRTPYNYARFGIVSQYNGGSFDVDYVRWTTDGAYVPAKVQRGTIICIK